MDRAERATGCASLLHFHRGLVETNVVDFITKDLWGAHVPSEWRKVLLQLSTEELLKLPTTLLICEGWPPCFKAFLKKARELSLSAQPEEAWEGDEHVVEEDAGMEKAIQKGMGDKKSHEARHA